MDSKRKAEEMITWWEYDFLHHMSFKFRRLTTWNADVNEAEAEAAAEDVPGPIDPAQDVMANDNDQMENQVVEDNEDMQMD